MLNIIYKILTSPLGWILDIILLIVIIVLEIHLIKIIGWFGEHWVKKELKKLPKDKYKILNDVMISINDRMPQIDHIVVSEYGIFVIETKQYNGYFTGGKYDKKWVRHGIKKYYYTNPIRQNYGHVMSICELLNLDKSKVFNIICIPSDAKLKIEHDGELTRYFTIVDKINSYKDKIIDNPDVYYQKIKESNITSKKLRKEHDEYVKKLKTDFDDTMCPKCGGKLVERKGEYGPFIGCSNYPKCKYTEKIQNKSW